MKIYKANTARVGLLAAAALLFAFATVAGSGKANAWSLEEASAPYRGAEIDIICEGYPPCYALQEVSTEFSEITGITVNEMVR